MKKKKKVKDNYKVNDNLVIAIISKKVDGVTYPKMVSYSMFEPKFGNKLKTDEICKDDTLIVQENLLAKLDSSKVNVEFILYFTKQNIDVFNLSSVFYTDICFHFDSPIDKDIALKDRILLCFPNVTLCENNCQIKGVNLTNLKAICGCSFSNLINNNILGSNILSQSQFGEIENILSQTNIEIIKCYEDITKYDFFISSTGGFIIIGLIFFQIIFTIVFCTKNLFLIQKYIFGVTDKFLSSLYSKKFNNNIANKKNTTKSKTMKYHMPPKKKSLINNVKKEFNEKKIERKNKKGKTRLTNKKKTNFKFKGNSLDSFENSPKQNILIHNNMTSKSIKVYKSKKLSIDDFSNKKIMSSNSYIKSTLILGLKNDVDININEYLITEFDDMEYDDAIKRDKRTFCQYFSDKLKSDQIILNTFFYQEPLKPRTIKIIFFILDIDLYLFVNALFINEEYVSEIFNSTEEETFFSFIPRSMDRFLYTTLVGVILNYIIDCFFVEEKKLKRILKREKDSEVILKYEITQILKTIKKRYLYFILISFIITVLTWYYIFCFNNIYPHMKSDWIKSSIVIIFIMQILSIMICLLETIIRFLSFKCKSEKIFKVSLFLS